MTDQANGSDDAYEAVRLRQNNQPNPLLFDDSLLTNDKYVWDDDQRTWQACAPMTASPPEIPRPPPSPVGRHQVHRPSSPIVVVQNEENPSPMSRTGTAAAPAVTFAKPALPKKSPLPRKEEQAIAFTMP